MYIKANPNGYALALFELVKEQKNFEEIHQQMKTLREIIDKNPELILYWKNANISLQDKWSLVDEILQGFDKLIINTCKVIIERRASFMMKKIVTHYLKLSNEVLNILFAKVITAFELDEATIEKIKNKLEKQTNKKIEILTEIDPDLISGFQIVFDTELYQRNYKNDLLNLKNQIINDERGR